MGNRESPGTAQRPWLWQVKHSCHNELLLHWALPKMGFFFLALSFFSPDTSSLNNIILLCPSSTRCSLTVFSYSLSEESSAPTSPPYSLPASASNWKYYHASDKSISKDIPSSFPSRLFFSSPAWTKQENMSGYKWCQRRARKEWLCPAWQTGSLPLCCCNCWRH